MYYRTLDGRLLRVGAFLGSYTLLRTAIGVA